MKKHRGSRAYRLKAEFWYPGECIPFEIVVCNRWFASTQKEAREQFIEEVFFGRHEFIQGSKIKCVAIARK